LKHPSLSVLIPAAGASKRLGQAKQLVRYKGQSLLQNAIDATQTLAPHEIIVVTGANAIEIEKTHQQASVRWVDNPHWSTGMGGSIAAGALAANPKSTGLMIVLCDQWQIEAQDLQKLAETWQADPTRIVAAEAEGCYMPPVIFPSEHFKQLQDLQGHKGARSLFKIFPEQLTSVPMQNATIDLDTKAQLDTLTNQS
jgi:molybdenum cofactor cytidylyltransferase